MELECLPCIFRQTLEACRMVTDDETIIREVINEYAKMIPKLKLNETAPMLVGKLQEIIKEKTGEEDPYFVFKEKNIALAESKYTLIEEIVNKSKDSLLTSLIISACGNVIDAGVNLNFDLDKTIEKAVREGFKYNDYNLFKQELKKASTVLIVADNSGEAVFDKLLIKELKRYNVEVFYAVRHSPILNDITMKEAKKIGLDKLCHLLSSGSITPGLILSEAKQNFLKLFKEADIIISKGQGNLEGLSKVKKKIYFLLKAKCDIVANLLDVKTGDLVFKLKE